MEHVKHSFDSIDELRGNLITSSNLAEIKYLMAESSHQYKVSIVEVEQLYNTFKLIQILCFMNMTFLLQHAVTFLFTSKLNRFYQFPSVLHVTDTIMFISSIIIIWWFNYKIMLNLDEPGQTKDEWLMRLYNNYRAEHLFKFQYFFSAQITCLILRNATLLQYNEKIGPLIKIVGKMTKDF
jgi:hypothetical protein